MKREDFGIPIKGRNYCLDNVLNTIVNKNDPVVVKARKIYSYIQKNFVCINGYNKFIKTDLQDVISKRSGTVGDINLLLIAMLKHENIDASPVLLSTTDFGRNSINYPQMEMINYIVAKFRNESTDYFLDATIPFLPFGKLPLKCYNGHARLIGQDTSAVFFTPEMITEDKAVTVFISNGVHNEMSGRYSNSMGFFESLETKSKIAKTSLKSFQTNIISSYPEGILFGDINLDSLTDSESPLKMHFDFRLDAFKNSDIVYFNPIFGEAVRKNPFYATERIYPVELPCLSDESYSLTMEIPQGYKIDELPKSAKIKLNEGDVLFEYIIAAEDNVIQIRSRLQVKRAIFSSEDYQTLRDFYAFIVNKEAEQIVFKKIK
jgi:hypothetical protein